MIKRSSGIRPGYRIASSPADAISLYPYSQRLLTVEPANLLAHWPLNEANGSAILNAAPSGSGLNGVYTGVDVGNTQGPAPSMGSAPFWDGVNDVGNVYSAALAAAFSGDEGTLAIWGKVTNSGVWADGTQRIFFRLAAGSGGADRLYLYKLGTGAIQVERKGGGVSKLVTSAVQSMTGWFHLVMTYTLSGDQLKGYLNGAAFGVTATGLSAWSGGLSSTNALLGSASTVAANVWNGWLDGAAAWSKALTAAQVASLAVAA